MRICQTLALSILFLMFCYNMVSATNLKKTEAKCPVCANRFSIAVVISTNSFGGIDPDLLERARGSQPVLYEIATCPRCYYSGYTDDFSPKAKVPEKIKKACLSKKVFKPKKSISRNSKDCSVPAWISYDLLAQEYLFMKKGKDVIGNAFLRASWAVRLGWEPAIYNDELFKEMDVLLRDEFKKNSGEKKERNAALIEIESARSLWKQAQNPKSQNRKLLLLTSLYVLRSHGENTDILSLLPLLKDLLTEEEYKRLEAYTTDSIFQERYYQKKVIKNFSEIVPETKSLTKKSIIIYLLGELNRRLENWTDAKNYYEEALKFNETPDYIREYVESQLKYISEKKLNL